MLIPLGRPLLLIDQIWNGPVFQIGGDLYSKTSSIVVLTENDGRKPP